MTAWLNARTRRHLQVSSDHVTVNEIEISLRQNDLNAISTAVGAAQALYQSLILYLAVLRVYFKNKTAAASLSACHRGKKTKTKRTDKIQLT